MSEQSHQEVALITGGGGGIGRETALHLAAQGAKVAVLDVNIEAAETTAAAVRDLGGEAIAIAADVTDRSAVQDAVATTERKLGALTIGVTSHGIGLMRPFLDFDDDAWNRVISVNLTGAMIVGQELARSMARLGYGRIVHLSSLSARMPVGGMAAYAASKAGIDGLTRAMAAELGPRGVTVNAIAPGPIQTELMLSMLDEVARRERIGRIPVRRLGEPEDVAALITFLTSRATGFINGITLTPDGGYSHTGPPANKAMA